MNGDGASRSWVGLAIPLEGLTRLGQVRES